MSKAAELAALIANVNNGSSLANKNFIINGAMNVAQRGTSSTSISSAGYRTVDRWAIKENSSGIALTETQSTDTPSGEGFSNSLKWEVTTADTSVASAERVHFGQTIEAQNLQSLQYGTSDAKPITLSFWVKSNVTGTYAVSIFKSDQTLRLLNKTYTINSVNTWEKKEIPIAGDTSGGGIDNNNGAGFQFDWFLTAGSGATTSSTNEWEAWDGAKWAGGHAVNFGSSTSNNFYITGVQLEIGEKATEFEHEPYSVTLQKAQRYYQRYAETGGSGSNAYLRYGIGKCETTTVAECFINSHTIMRADPTFGTTGTVSNYAIYDAESVIACSGLVIQQSGHSNNQLFVLTATVSSGLTAGRAVSLMNNNTTAGYLEFIAEL